MAEEAAAAGASTSPAALHGGPSGVWLAKAHKAALCIVAPYSTWPAIQRIRAMRDKGFCRWPPHINLLYPFHEDRGACFERAAEAAAAALAGLPPFRLTLARLRVFEHSPRSCTLWLEPEAPELARLQAALQAAFPSCTDLSDDPGRGITSFVPHLSLGQWGSPAAARGAMERLQAAWQPLVFTVQEVVLLSRQGYNDPFSARYAIPLGATGDARAVDVPYIASAGAGQELMQCGPADRARFGVGALPQLWNFAYGANINAAKLTAARGLRPLASKPAVLQGYRLAFNHRGGFGNLVPLQAGEAPPPSGGVHGVLHAFTPADMAALMCMEHEYMPTEVAVQPAEGGEPQVALAFITPPEREIADGLPTTSRYLDLIVQGASDWQLPGSYRAWLQGQPTIDSSARGDAYCTSPAGAKLAAWPKIRTGSQKAQQGRRGDGVRGRQQGGGWSGGGGGGGGGAGSGQQRRPSSSD